MPMLEAIEQRATAQGVPVDARIERGRSYRHALASLLEHEDVRPGRRPGERHGQQGSPATTWSGCCERRPPRSLILRPAPSDASRVSVALDQSYRP